MNSLVSIKCYPMCFPVHKNGITIEFCVTACLYLFYMSMQDQLCLHMLHVACSILCNSNQDNVTNAISTDQVMESIWWTS